VLVGAPQSDVELAITLARKIERALLQRGGTGAGLREKAASFGGSLPAELAEAIEWIAYERNCVVHEYDATLSERESYERACEYVLRSIEGLSPGTLVVGASETRLPRFAAPKAGLFAGAAGTAIVIGWAFALIVVLFVWHPWR
jgi:hypothetical protein